MKISLLALLAVFAPLVACSGGTDGAGSTSDTAEDDALSTAGLSPKAALGKLIFNDKNLSEPAGQSCATCHDPSKGFSDQRGTPTSQGAQAGVFGVRNAPGIRYASFTPPISATGDEAGYGGGLFWDGRAPALQVQAQGPLLNPIEMNNTDAAMILAKVKKASYASKFTAVYGADALGDATTAFNDLTDAIAEYETTGITKRFTSKFDYVQAGKAKFTASQARGFALFESTQTGPCTPPDNSPPCGCAQCHLDQKQADGTPPMFTDFGYDNIGIPKNPNNGFYKDPSQYNPDGANYTDSGLGVAVHNPRQFGRFKAPTLRDVAVTAPYGHNGYFADLKSIVHFYNTRDDRTQNWPAPEVSFNLNTTGAIGSLGLTDAQENDLIAFLKTLTDGYVPSAALQAQEEAEEAAAQ